MISFSKVEVSLSELKAELTIINYSISRKN